MKRFKRKAKVWFGYISHPTLNVYGQCWPGGEIEINLKKSNALKTFLHELIHNEYPHLSEKQVRAMERRLWKKMTQEDIFRLGKRLFNRKYNKETK
jgi:hypothetical protein